jgi:hypothetical protein
LIFTLGQSNKNWLYYSTTFGSFIITVSRGFIDMRAHIFQRA